MRKDRSNPVAKPDCTIIQIVPTTKRSQPKTFLDVIGHAQAIRGKDQKERNLNTMESSSIERLDEVLLEKLRRELNAVGNHSLRLVESFEMETEKVYELRKDGTVLLEDGRIVAPIEYFIELFSVGTSSAARRKIEATHGDSQTLGQMINIQIAGKQRLKMVYDVLPVREKYEEERK
jgi:hypothetical protein